MRFSHPDAPINKADAPAKGASAAGKTPQPKAGKPDGKAQEGPGLQYLTVDVVGGHLHLQPTRGSAAGKNTPGATAAVSKEAELVYGVTKALDEERYTFGPLYTPNELDAHQEYVRGDQLTKAMRDFARSGVRTVNKQHQTGSAPIGDIVDWVVWPYEQEVELQLPGREVRKSTLPAGTAYVGVLWNPEEWPAVKGGAITGYSLGGRAMRVQTGELLPPSRR